MADILIKGLKLPEGANELRLIIHPNGQVLIVKQTYWEETEAIEIPDHGDLIDRDALDADLEKQDMKTGEWDAIGFSIYEIENAPIVIPADHFRDATKMVKIDAAPTVIPAFRKE